jgi:hypothetical protein
MTDQDRLKQQFDRVRLRTESWPESFRAIPSHRELELQKQARAAALESVRKDTQG